MNFGDCLKSILDDREISQREFARQLNIAPTTLNGYIRNTRQPDFERKTTVITLLKKKN